MSRFPWATTVGGDEGLSVGPFVSGMCTDSATLDSCGEWTRGVTGSLTDLRQVTMAGGAGVEMRSGVPSTNSVPAAGGRDTVAEGAGVSVGTAGRYASGGIASGLKGTTPHALKPCTMFSAVTADSKAFLKRAGKLCLFTTWYGDSDKNSEHAMSYAALKGPKWTDLRDEAYVWYEGGGEAQHFNLVCDRQF